jgi:hypothetical protein
MRTRSQARVEATTGDPAPAGTRNPRKRGLEEAPVVERATKTKVAGNNDDNNNGGADAILRSAGNSSSSSRSDVGSDGNVRTGRVAQGSPHPRRGAAVPLPFGAGVYGGEHLSDDDDANGQERDDGEVEENDDCEDPESGDDVEDDTDANGGDEYEDDADEESSAFTESFEDSDSDDESVIFSCCSYDDSEDDFWDDSEDDFWDDSDEDNIREDLDVENAYLEDDSDCSVADEDESCKPLSSKKVKSMSVTTYDTSSLLGVVFTTFTDDADSLKLYDAETFELRGVLKGFLDETMELCFSRDCTKVATAGYGVRVWDLVSLKRLMKVNRGQRRIASMQTMSVQFDNSGDRLLCRSRDGFIRIWNVVTKQKMLTIIAQDIRLMKARFSCDGSKIFADRRMIDGWDDTFTELTVWDAVNGNKLFSSEKRYADATALEANPVEDSVAIASRNKKIDIYNWSTSPPRRVIIPGVGHQIYQLIYSPDGTKLAGCGSENVSRVFTWDAINGDLLHSVRVGHMLGLAVNWRCNRVAFIDEEDGSVIVSDLITGDRLTVLDRDWNVTLCYAQPSMMILM